jgi:hypothetical protein
MILPINLMKVQDCNIYKVPSMTQFLVEMITADGFQMESNQHLLSVGSEHLSYSWFPFFWTLLFKTLLQLHLLIVEIVVVLAANCSRQFLLSAYN